ncbi:type II toxin-antitoxin system PemK/MazF family toxin [Singulisphaera acidiphila]|uniref:mRNA interferase n=1 Tax=Singulisphaera acidiphila (strain ATCC BAA-1392 / DSM 18658 / VKM B-2454 / MOB10) TaxID=886293 RepID=L0DRK9_SINAD|nr:type II toxin-antitoxin system PemK/MazF family toxin [Singulisphaera acidiphila]AGA31653.1 growth inhibitor [Singulisphaera acidiphila DSM 18658]
MNPTPMRGEIWMVDLDPTKGREQAGRRPALVISVDPFNQGPAQLVVVIPISSTDRKVRSHVPIAPPEGGLDAKSFVMCEAMRSISKERLAQRWGAVSSSTLAGVEERLRFLLGL